MKYFGIQAATELQFSCENLGIYVKTLLLQSWDYKVFTWNISFYLEGYMEKLEYRKDRGLETNENNSCYF